jgi:creatinine amidohydrolase/Fe(II)-dependent formamide hydrolase-like protein
LPGKAAGVAVLPVAAYENHGVLPLEADLIIAECVSRRAAGSCSGVELLPAIPYSVSIEHAVPRVTVSPTVFIEYLYEVASSILEAYKGLVVAVFHGGAYHAAYIAARMARARLGGRVAVFNFWQCVERVLAEDYGLRYSLIHADPAEASILLSCGCRSGVKPAPLGDVVEALKLMAGRRRLVVQPWIHSDVPSLYPREPVPASEELGGRIVSRCSQELCRLAELVGRTAHEYPSR